MIQIILKSLDLKFDTPEIKCLHKDTMVVVDGEETTIADVVDNNKGEKILSYNEETGVVEEKEILGKFNNGEIDEWLLIEMDDGTTIKVTPNHRFYTKNRGYVRADELTEEDDLVGNVIKT